MGVFSSFAWERSIVCWSKEQEQQGEGGRVMYMHDETGCV